MGEEHVDEVLPIALSLHVTRRSTERKRERHREKERQRLQVQWFRTTPPYRWCRPGHGTTIYVAEVEAQAKKSGSCHIDSEDLLNPKLLEPGKAPNLAHPSAVFGAVSVPRRKIPTP